MKQMIRKIINNKLIILTAIISILVAYSPYMQKDLVIGSDWSFHLIRIETLASALARGEFPVKFHSDLCYGFGYGVGFFYSNLFLYIPAVLINMGFSLEVAYKLLAGLIFLSLYIGMFSAIWEMTYNKYVSATAATTYVLSVSVLESFYQHFALGRSLALIFIPMALCGMYLVISRDRGRRLLEIGFIGLIYSHALSTILTVVVCAIFLLVLFREWISDRRKWESLLLAVGVVSLMTAAYWIPLLEQWTAQEYRASQPWTYVDENVIPVFELLSDYAIGRLLLCLSLLLGFWILERACEKKVKVFYFTGIGFSLITVVYHFWHIFRNVFKFLQFPYRLFSLSTVLIIIALALWLDSFHLKKIWLKICMIILLVVNVGYAYQYMEGRINELEDLGYRTLHEEIAGLGAGEEWLPVQTTREYLKNPTIAKNSNGTSIEGKRIDNCFVFTSEENAEYCDIPFVWYKGFCALTEDGKELQVSQVPETGLARVNTENLSASSKITVWYRGTWLQNVAYLISFAASLIWIFFTLYKKIRGLSKYGEFKK